MCLENNVCWHVLMKSVNFKFLKANSFFSFVKILGTTHCAPLEVSFQPYHESLKAQRSRRVTPKNNFNYLNYS